MLCVRQFLTGAIEGSSVHIPSIARKRKLTHNKTELRFLFLFFFLNRDDRVREAWFHHYQLKKKKENAFLGNCLVK